MIVSFAVCHRDYKNALDTLAHALKLEGGPVPFDCILSVGDGIDLEPVREACEKLFRRVTFFGSDAPETWPQGKNHTFQNLVRHLDEVKNTEPFFWWEPDAIPLRKGWLSMIAQAHVMGGKPFTGYVHPRLNYMECVGVYPPNFMEYSPTNGMLCRAASWDVCSRHEVAPQTHAINDLLQFVHDIDGMPPSFETMELINPSAVLFHKNKDGTLAKLLTGETKGPLRRIVDAMLTPKPDPKSGEKIWVVFPVCAKDIDQAIVHAEMLKSFQKRFDHMAIVAFDSDCPFDKVTRLVGLMCDLFTCMERFVYPAPPHTAYPEAANWAFRHVAQYMANGTAPWLWMEADTVVLSADWLDVLQAEYDTAGKPFMGAIVRENGHGHMNGVGIYPADTLRRIPRAMEKTSTAWDFAMRPEMIGDCHDASPMITHIWGVANGQPSQTNGANPPQKLTRYTARKLIPKNAVIIHRIKDSSLVDLIMGGWKR